MHSFKKSNRNFIKLNRTTNWDKTNKLLSGQITPSLAIAAVHTRQVTRPYSYIISLTFYFERYKINSYVHVTLHSTEGEWNMRHVNGTFEHDRHCTYNVTLRCVRTTIVAVQMQWILHNLSVCICSLRYTTYAIFSTVAYNILPHYLMNGTLFGKKLLNIKCVFWSSLLLLSETFLILRKNERDMIKIRIGLEVKYPLFLSDFNETWIFVADFRKILKYQISWRSVQWEPSYSMRTDWQTEGNDKANIRFSQVRKSA